MHKYFLRFSSIVIICISIFSVQPLSGRDNARSVSEAEPVFRWVQYELAQGDTAAAVSLLDRALEIDADHGDSRLWRGSLHLAAGDFDSAKEDFTRALNSKSPGTRARAHVGLGHIQIRNPKQARQAANHYRQAIKLDPTCFDALYDLAHVGFMFSELSGKRVASRELAWLICRDPLYENAYRVWRDLAFDKRANEIREVDKRLEAFLEAYPDSASWWVDLARDRFYLGETSLALETLDEMARANPDYISTDIPLLQARCYLETGNTKAFHDYYHQALLIAESTNDFTRLFRQAEPLFYPSVYLSWETCLTSNSRADFFRQFWGALKPDPLESFNPRLATHYSRLRLAEKNHKFQLPNIPYQTSLAMSFPKDILHLFCHGRKINKTEGESKSYYYGRTPAERKIINPLKFWCIGYSGSLYDFTKKTPNIVHNMLEAIQMQYDTDINIFHSGILQYACFQSAKQGKIEVGIFQGGIPGSKVKPKAEIAIFDTSWKELERKESTVYQEAEFKKTKLWFSLHRLERQPGIYWFGVRTRTTNGAKWIERGLMDLRGFSKKNLDLSKAVLGSLPQDDSETYSRNYIEFVPRLSLKFKRDEIISVYLEIYNLGQNQTGSRGYMLEVNVTLVEDDTKKESDYAGGTVKTRNLDPEKSSTSIHHEFERTPVNYSGPVAEFFTIDTSQLRLGSYRMIIKINDNSNSSSSQTSCIFELGG